MTETLWASVFNQKDGLYKLDNIPFYVPSVACNDIVFAEFDEAEGFITFREVTSQSGNSTIQVVILDKSVLTNDLRDVFDHLGCSSEKFDEGYFVIDVPTDTEYGPIKKRLSELQQHVIIDYAESCLSDKHRKMNGF
ncbi:MAG TPA: DUF4265 domain-containing protein [Puia sp.]|nr:DUF4265 domain-containing protein [Puia sp.]